MARAVTMPTAMARLRGHDPLQQFQETPGKRRRPTPGDDQEETDDQSDGQDSRQITSGPGVHVHQLTDVDLPTKMDHEGPDQNPCRHSQDHVGDRPGPGVVLGALLRSTPRSSSSVS